MDDVAYLTELLDALPAQVRVDPTRVVLMGHSAGGFMAYRMACEVPGRVAAVVSIAGSGFLDPTDCHADRPVSLLQVHGMDDETMPIVGDDAAPAAREMLRRWGARGGCDEAGWSTDASPLELVADAVTDETTVKRYTTGCAPGVGVDFWKRQGSNHYPVFRRGFAEAVLDWIRGRSAQPLP